MEMISLDSVGINVCEDGMCFWPGERYEPSVALPDTYLQSWRHLSSDDLVTLQGFIFLHFPQLMSWVDILVDFLQEQEITTDILMERLLSGGTI